MWAKYKFSKGKVFHFWLTFGKEDIYSQYCGNKVSLKKHLTPAPLLCANFCKRCTTRWLGEQKERMNNDL